MKNPRYSYSGSPNDFTDPMSFPVLTSACLSFYLQYVVQYLHDGSAPNFAPPGVWNLRFREKYLDNFFRDSFLILNFPQRMNPTDFDHPLNFPYRTTMRFFEREIS